MNNSCLLDKGMGQIRTVADHYMGKFDPCNPAVQAINDLAIVLAECQATEQLRTAAYALCCACMNKMVGETSRLFKLDSQFRPDFLYASDQEQKEMAVVCCSV